MRKLHPAYKNLLAHLKLADDETKDYRELKKVFENMERLLKAHLKVHNKSDPDFYKLQGALIKLKSMTDSAILQIENNTFEPFNSNRYKAMFRKSHIHYTLEKAKRMEHVMKTSPTDKLFENLRAELPATFMPDFGSGE